MMKSPSLDDLRAIARLSNAVLPLALIEYRAGEPDYGKLCDLIDRAIDSCALRMSQFPKEMDGQTEDQLSIMLILQLCQIGFNATHDTTSGGHCDIVISEGAEFLWLGEAKKVSAVNNFWIAAGYDQLVGRYATGQPGQDRGSLIIFCNCERIDIILEKWLEYFIEKYPNASIISESKDEIIFNSAETSIRTGRPFKVRHKTISAYFAPLHT